MQKGIFILCMLMVLGIAKGISQPSPSVLSLEDGLSQSTIFAISQDQKGFLWFGTEDGLNRYDGYEFKVFKHEPFDTTSLAANQVSALLTDKKGRLWVGLTNLGLSLFEPNSNSFRNFLSHSEDSTSLSSNNITEIHEDAAGNIWVGTFNGFNKVVVSETGEVHFEHFFTRSETKTTSKDHVVECFLEDSQGNFWVSTRSALFQFNRLNHAMEEVELPRREMTKGYWKGSVNTMTEDRLGNLWVGNGNTYYKWDPKTSSWEVNPGPESLKGDFYISTMKLGINGEILIGTMGKGFFILPFDPATQTYSKEWIHYGQNESGSRKLNSDHIRCLYADRLNPNILWIGHPTSGIEKVSRIPASFFSDYLKDPALKPLKSTFVASLEKDRAGNTWIGTDMGLIRYGDEYEVYQAKYGKPNHLSGNYIRGMMLDHEGALWVSTPRGLDRIESPEEKNILIEHCEVSIGCKEYLTGTLYEDRDHFFYVGIGKGFNVMDPETQEFWHCGLNPDPVYNKVLGYRVNDMIRDRQNRVWIGTSAGLILYRDIRNPVNDLPNSKPEYYYHEANDITSLRNHTVLCIREDRNGEIWLGTFNGLIKVKDSGDRLYFQSFTEKNGLSNNVVYGILEDPKENALWMSTNKGLSKLDLTSMNFENFDSRDGLQSNEFNGGAYLKTDDGMMYFGGINGYTWFDPREVVRDTIAPQVWVTSYTSMDNMEHNLLYRPEKSIELTYRENSFAVNFISLNYNQPEGNRYAYRLEGLNEKFIPCGDSRKINFSNLSPGNYTFHVIGSNSHGQWNRVGDTLEITVKPPYWQTAWFYLLLVALLAIAFGVFHKLRVKTKVRRVMELERVRKNAAADFHDELGHKLTVISLFGEIVKKKLESGDGNLPRTREMIPQVNKIIESANSLYYSMKDLLWVLDPNKDSVYDLSILLKDFGDELFDKTGIDFRVEGIDTEMKGINLPMDHKRHIVLVFKEVMNNALRHSGCKYAVLKVKFKQNNLRIKFHDDGKGFDPSRVMQGNGLLNLRSRAEKLSGVLDVSSNGHGTEVSLACEV